MYAPEVAKWLWYCRQAQVADLIATYDDADALARQLRKFFAAGIEESRKMCGTAEQLRAADAAISLAELYLPRIRFDVVAEVVMRLYQDDLEGADR